MLSEKLRSLASAFRPGNPLGFSRGLPGEFMGNLADLLDHYATEAETVETAAGASTSKIETEGAAA